ncbi:MAG: C25 family cysteine peptidase, partial [Acidobacteria bacterium]|nr:C25 family cysteine peptidase [Acidobacteriota bacterium]
WTNFGSCSIATTTQCTKNADCPGSETCIADFSLATTQSLQAVCTINVEATWVSVSDFRATRDGRDVVVEWRTDAEVGTVGFDLYRFDEASGDNIQVNRDPVFALLRTEGAAYTVIDRGAPFSDKLIYTIIETDLQGVRREVGPFEVVAEPRGFDRRSASLEEFEGGRAFVPSKRQARRADAARAQARAFREERGGSSRAPGSGAGGLAASIEQTGLYRVTAAELAGLWQITEGQAANKIRRGRVKLSSGGVEVEWLAAGDNSELYFYGSSIDSQFTTENVYRIRRARGTILDRVFGGNPSPVTGGAFVDRVHHEEDVIPAVVVAQDPASDYWYWDGIIAQSTNTTRSFDFDVDDPTNTGAAELAVLLFGATDDPLIASEHHAIVRLNGVELGSTIWDGVGDHAATFAVNPKTLIAGSNTVEIEAILGPGVSNSLFFIDSFDLEYSRSHRAVEDSLHFPGTGGVISIDGFTEDAIRVFDITDPSSPQLVVHTTIDAPGGGYRVSFDSANPASRYFTVADAAVSSPLALVGEIANIDLRSSHGADYVLVAPAFLTDAAAELADYRSTTGYRTLVVSLEEIYTQFNEGVASPHAITAFVEYAYLNWSYAPRFLTLVGAASLDYRDLLGHGGNLVPTLMVATPWGLFSSDLAFGDAVGNDAVPEVSVGRVPIFTAAEFSDYVAKVVSYEANAGSVWRSRALMMADDPGPAGNFPLDSRAVEAMLAPPLTTSQVDLSVQSIAEAREAMFTALEEGVGFVNYVGHGGVTVLADERLLTVADVPGLANEGVEPIMASATCIIGRYAVPGLESLAEALVVESDGGAVAVWAPSGLSFNDDAVLLNRAMANAAFSAPGATLGESVLEALRSYEGAGGFFDHMLSIFNVLGDPALAMHRNGPSPG